jgi:hypothetical protein
MGGNLELVKWLVVTHGCPISVKRDLQSGSSLSVQTSAGRTLIDLAMTGKPKISILSYLVRQNLSILDTKDPHLAPKTLQTLMKAGFRFELIGDGGDHDDSIHVIESDSSVVTLEDAVSTTFFTNNQQRAFLLATASYILPGYVSVSYVAKSKWIAF